MNYSFKNGKHVIEKDGVYFALSMEQVTELNKITSEIIQRDLWAKIGDGIISTAKICDIPITTDLSDDFLAMEYIRNYRNKTNDTERGINE